MAREAMTVELYGVPRLLAGRRAVAARGATLAEVARALAEECPALAGPVLDPATWWVRDGYAFVVDERFTRDPATRVAPGAAVLLVASSAGG